MANFAGAVAAIRSRVAAMRPVELPIGWPNEARPDVIDANGNPAPWAYAEVSSTGAEIRGVGVPGDHVVVEEGVIMMTVFVPDGEGTATAYGLAGQLGEIFRVQQFYDAEPGVCIRTWTPRISGGDSGSDDGMWFAVSVSIPFQFWRRA